MGVKDELKDRIELLELGGGGVASRTSGLFREPHPWPQGSKST